MVARPAANGRVVGSSPTQVENILREIESAPYRLSQKKIETYNLIRELVERLQGGLNQRKSRSRYQENKLKTRMEEICKKIIVELSTT